jgi:LPS-assembly protein
VCFALLFTVLAPQVASPQIGRIFGLPQAPATDYSTLERPNFSVRVPRPNAPPEGEYILNSVSQESEGGITKLHGGAVVEMHSATLKADEIEYDENTRVFNAHGHVSYRNYDQNELVYCDHAVYNMDTEKGMFYLPKGFARSKVVTKPGMLVSQEPFYFEGAFVEKTGEKYILHDGFITDCSMPNPWWKLHSTQIDITPEDHALAHNAVYRLHNVPLFYFPVFYKSLHREPRHSGFLTPHIGHSTTRGFMVGGGYYWAINRSMDLTYEIQDFTVRGLAHNVDFRGKPTQKTDFNLIVYGVQDQGYYQGATLVKTPGFSVIGKFRSEIGNGWIVRGSVDYLSSLAFRQQFTESFNEAIFAETKSAGWIEKRFSYYTFTAGVSRLENFQDATPENTVIIRKLPETEFQGRDQEIVHGPIPLWVSFDSTFGLYHRVQPRPEPDFYETGQFTPRGDFEPTVFSTLRWGHITLLPSLTLHESFYGQSLEGSTISNAITRSAPEVNVDIVLPSLERIYAFKSGAKNGVKWKHVFEPRASYREVSGVQNFENTLRFDTLDLLSNTNEATVGITNRLYRKQGNDVREVFTWEVSQKVFFDPGFGGAVISNQRNVILSSLDLTAFSFLDGPRRYSPIVSTVRTRPRNGIDITWQTDYDPHSHRFVNSTFQTSYRIKKYFASAASDQIHPDPIISPQANQFRATFGYGDPNRKGWNTAYSMVYDWRIHQLEYGVAQAAYNTDCCGIAIQIRRLSFSGRNENQYLASFSVANLGSFGSLKKQERLF